MTKNKIKWLTVNCDTEIEPVQKVKSPKQPNQNNKTLKTEEK